MLYDPKWGKPATKNWRLLDNLIAWLETKAPDESYIYSDPTNCLLAQYLRAHGKRHVWITGETATYSNNRFLGWLPWFRTDDRLPRYFNEIALQSTGPSYRTFGGALVYARKAREHNIFEQAR